MADNSRRVSGSVVVQTLVDVSDYLKGKQSLPMKHFTVLCLRYSRDRSWSANETKYGRRTEGTRGLRRRPNREQQADHIASRRPWALGEENSGTGAFGSTSRSEPVLEGETLRRCVKTGFSSWK